jgi:hypothetical protein
MTKQCINTFKTVVHSYILIQNIFTQMCLNKLNRNERNTIDYKILRFIMQNDYLIINTL